MITGAFKDYIVDTIDERDSLINIARPEGTKVYVKDNGKKYEYIGGEFIVMGGTVPVKITVGTVEPTDPEANDIWIDTN